MARFVVEDGPEKGKAYPLSEKTLIGSGEDCGIRLGDSTVDAKHALVVDEPRGHHLYALVDGHGTLVNDAPVETRLLRDGDRVRLGQTLIVYRTEAPSSGLGVPGAPRVVISESAETEIFSAVPARPDLSSEGGELKTRFQKVCHISSVIGLKLDLDRILEEALNSFFDIFPLVERGVILLYEPGSQTFVPRTIKDRRGAAKVVAVPRTVLDHVVSRHEAIVSADAMRDQRFAAGVSIRFQKVRFMMCTPMICQDEILGAIYLDSTMSSRFSEEDLLLLSGIGTQVAVAIKNAEMNRSLRETEQLERELAIARTIQQSLLPHRIQVPDGWELATTSRPAREVGGDFYDVLRTKRNGLSLVIGDVSGKGIAAALYMAGVLSELRFLLGSVDEIERAAALANESLVDREAMGMFVTAEILSLDPASGIGSFVSAGHPDPILLRGGNRLEEPKDSTGGPPLGVSGEAHFESNRLRLEKGDAAILYTDGALEARSPEGTLYGKARLHAALVGGGTADQMLERVTSDIRKFSGAAGQTDDLTLVIARRIG